MTESECSHKINIFADCLNIAGEIVEHPSVDDLVKLEDRLKNGQLIPFCISRNADRDAAMEFDISGMLIGIVGTEDSAQRGSFGYCLLDLKKSSSKVLIGPEFYPEYCTTNDVKLVIAIARTFFLTGELDRSATWHVSRQGLGGPREAIPDREILYANNERQSLSSLLSSI